MTAVMVERPVENHGIIPGPLERVAVESERSILDAPLEVRLANMRAWQLHLENRGMRLNPVLEARLRALEAVAETERATRAGLPFRQRFPALFKWATEIIAHRRTRTPLEVAAAYELVAVQCEEAGQWEYAARVLDLAARQIVNGRDT